MFFCYVVNFKKLPALILIISHSLSDFIYAQNEKITVKQDSLITKLMFVKKKIDSESYESKYFTIQLYYGNLKEAENILKDFKEKFPNWEANLSFETPNYKVQIGYFKDYYFGMSKLKQIKNIYSSAFLLEMKN